MATFQVSDKTVKILKNFAGISNSIILNDGTRQRTLSKGKSVLATAELPEAWPKETAIFDLNRFLGTLSIFKTPLLTFGEESVSIKDGKSFVGYRYSDPTTIDDVPSKNFPTNDPGIKFSLKESELAQLAKATSLLELTSVAFVVADGAVTVGASDAKNPTSHRYEFEVEEVFESKEGFTAKPSFSTEHLAMLMPGAYDVSLSTWNYGYFEHKTEPVSYYIVVQA